VRAGKQSWSRYAVILGVGASLGAGPLQCNLHFSLDLGFGSGSGSGSGSQLPAPPTPPPPSVPSPAGPPEPAATPPIASAPRRDEPTTRESHAPKKPVAAAPRVLVPDEVVMAAVRTLQPTFVACWKRAQRNDPALASARVRISLEVDETGAIVSSRTDAEDEKLSRCLANVARKLVFPPLGRAAAFEIPLYF
jgi:hypothetical protein